jgi:hypothetical protein
MADSPPPSGLLVSMVSETITGLLEVLVAGRVTQDSVEDPKHVEPEGMVKWQFTPGGSEAQPSAIVSA